MMNAQKESARTQGLPRARELYLSHSPTADPTADRLAPWLPKVGSRGPDFGVAVSLAVRGSGVHVLGPSPGCRSAKLGIAELRVLTTEGRKSGELPLDDG
jgi:hypothetical protein